MSCLYFKRNKKTIIKVITEKKVLNIALCNSLMTSLNTNAQKQ